jgi:hypothetical protein
MWVGDANATPCRSRPFLPRIRESGLPASLVAQEGAEQLRLPWDEFDVLFLGGQTTKWKLVEPTHSLEFRVNVDKDNPRSDYGKDRPVDQPAGNHHQR